MLKPGDLEAFANVEMYKRIDTHTDLREERLLMTNKCIHQ